MKNILATTVIALFVSAAAAQTGGGIAVSEVKMTRTADSVTVEMIVAISPDAVPDLQGMEVVPVISGVEERNLRFPAVVVNGRNRARVYERQAILGYGELADPPPLRVVNLDPESPDTTVEYSARVAGGDWVEDASMNIVWVLVSPAGERHSYSTPVAGE